MNSTVTLAYTTGGSQKIDETCNRFYIRAQLPTRRDFIVTLINGVYTPTALAAEIQRALRAVPELSSMEVQWIAASNAIGFNTQNVQLLIVVPSLQNLLTLVDWIGPPYDATNPRAFNAFISPSLGFSQIAVCTADFQSAETLATGTLAQGVFTGAQLTTALQTIVRVSIPNATLTWDATLGSIAVSCGTGFRMRFVGNQGFNRH